MDGTTIPVARKIAIIFLFLKLLILLFCLSKGRCALYLGVQTPEAAKGTFVCIWNLRA